MALSVRVIGLVIMLAALGAAVASFFYNKAQEADQAARVAMQVNARLSDQLSILDGVRALYQSDKTTGGASVRAYLAALQPQARAPGMQGVGIAIAMERATPAAVEARLRENYGRDIPVWPTTSQPVGFPIVLIEPDDPLNHEALGYDMYSEPVRREAMRRAWQSGQAAASGIVQLVQEKQADSKQPGFLIYLPVYAGEPLLDAGTAPPAEGAAGPPVVATARGARPIEAFVYAPFRIHDLMTSVLGTQIEGIEGIEVTAGEGPAAPRVFVHGKIGWDAHVQRLRVADRQWTMRISYGRFIDRLGRPIAILIFGIAIAFLAIQLHKLQHRRLGAFQALAEEKERHAEDRELMIGEMAHRMKNAFARIGALARITLRESKDLEDFETRFDGRLRALSDAKQMLVTGAVDTVDLGKILRRELDIAGWPADRLAMLTGPEVRLEDEGAQAIALAVHELVTNSIKYGALAGQGELTLGWRRDADNVELDWIESGLSETPRFDSESFGTQFIRSLIERQLKGSWNRSAADRSLTVRIRWPAPD
jgi:two-component sensor histidine kinase